MVDLSHGPVAQVFHNRFHRRFHLVPGSGRLGLPVLGVHSKSKGPSMFDSESTYCTLGSYKNIARARTLCNQYAIPRMDGSGIAQPPPSNPPQSKSLDSDSPIAAV